MCALFADALSWIEYLKEMNIERERRINQLEEGNTRVERRMRELEEVLVMMQSCHCQQGLCPGLRENPIKVSDLDYTEEYLTPPITSSSGLEEGEVPTNRSIGERVCDTVIILWLFTPKESAHLS